MLRFLVTTAALCASVALAADAPIPSDPESGRFVYQEVVPVDGVAASELYARAKGWLAIAYRSAQDVIQLDDREGGKIVGRGSIRATGAMGAQFNVRHVLTIEVKDGRYRYTLTDFVVDYGRYGETPLEGATGVGGIGKKATASLDAEARSLVASLRAAMLKPATGDDW